MSFAWPWCFLLLPAAWLARHFLPAREEAVALRIPVLPSASTGNFAVSARPASWFAWLAWCLLVVAVARPQLPGEALLQPVTGRNLMIALDLSARMAERDMSLAARPVDRLTVAQRVIHAFLDQRRGDRVGLIVFGSQAYLHTPLTFDGKALAASLASLEVGLAGNETALGDAMGLAIKHLEQLPGERPVLVLLTDGLNTAGTLDPDRAAWLASRAGMITHVVAIGTAAGGDNPDKLEAESRLQAIAQQTGGSYQRATDTQAVAGFFDRLDQLEPARIEDEAIRPVTELYRWPLGLAFLIALGLVFSQREGRMP